MPKDISKTKQSGIDTQSLLEATEQGHRNLSRLPFAYGRLAKNKTLDGGAETKIYHGLGRYPVGYFFTDVYSSIAPGHITIVRRSWDKESITLYSTGASAVTVDVWVF